MRETNAVGGVSRQYSLTPPLPQRNIAPMRQIAEDKLLPTDIDAQPQVRAAAALRSVNCGYRDEIEREQRLPKTLVEQFHAAGFYSLVMPRALVGLQADPLTYVRVVELLAEGAGSVGWNRSEGTRLNSSHGSISYAVFCLKKKI